MCSSPYVVTGFPLIPLTSKVSLPKKPSAEKFLFSKTVLCIFFPFRCWEFSLCKHASGVHGSPTRVCYFVFFFHVKSMLEKTGGSQPRRGKTVRISPELLRSDLRHLRNTSVAFLGKHKLNAKKKHCYIMNRPDV